MYLILRSEQPVGEWEEIAAKSVATLDPLRTETIEDIIGAIERAAEMGLPQNIRTNYTPHQSFFGCFLGRHCGQFFG
jgi:hypothetical protein